MNPPSADSSLPRRRSKRKVLAVALALLVVGAVGLVAAAAVLVPTRLWADVTQRTPLELVGYADRRLEGHPQLQALARPVLDYVRHVEQREAPAALPALGKGQQEAALPRPPYDAQGRPVPTSMAVSPSLRVAGAQALTRTVTDAAGLAQALAEAQPGEVIEAMPGTYVLLRSLKTGQAGEAARPIVLRAQRPGSVVIETQVSVAVEVDQPYWMFENLEIRGTCVQQNDCEHAFHIYGPARGVVLLNNRLVDFNAPLKVNGKEGRWPDDGLLQFNTLRAAAPRKGDRPVSFVDMVGASGWRIVDNHVEGFVKDGSDRISYGICVKGGGAKVQIERNLVVCTPEGVWQPGARVGISLGCGGTGAAYCREGAGGSGASCDVEHAEGVVSNNIVAHCNDSGIDGNRARDATVSQNTLINTAGIDARSKGTVLQIYGNLLEGRALDRDGARIEAHGDIVVHRLSRFLSLPEALDLRWREPAESMRPTPENPTDFCAQPRPFASPPGATIQPRCDLGR